MQKEDPTPARRKVAVLGGGLGSLSAVFELTHPDNPRRDDYEFTVYQIGWRLGGKGASGRNMRPAYAHRIEEHGLHVFFGFYDNTLKMMQEALAELNRPAGAPQSTFEKAFQPHDLIVLEQKVGDRWTTWPMIMPSNDDKPGIDQLWDTPVAYIEECLGLLHQLFRRTGRLLGHDPKDHGVEHALLESINRLLGPAHAATAILERLLLAAMHLARLLAKGEAAARSLLEKETGLVEHFLDRSKVALHLEAGALQLGLRALASVLTRFRDLLWKHIRKGLEDDIEVLRAWVFFNFSVGNIVGFVEDELLRKGFDSINEQDYMEWLARYVVDDDGLTARSPLASCVYAGCFAYVDGDTDRPSMEAGTVLRTMVRMLFTYKGHVQYKMTAGMGDTIFGPLYEVLKRRGVKFRFFHKVERLGLADDGKSIGSIHLGRQVDLVPRPDAAGGDTATTEYQPMIDVEKLPCWPENPLYDQIVDGDKLERQGIDLESYIADWPTAENVTLVAGEDFNEVLLGISLAALPTICRELIDANNGWRDMVARVGTVRTQGFQIWLEPPLACLGWDLAAPVLTCYDVNPFNTWADMSHLLDRETWPSAPGHKPHNVAYFCGPMPEPAGQEPNAPTPRLDAVTGWAIQLLESKMGHLWPKATTPQKVDTGPLAWDLLIDNRQDAPAPDGPDAKGRFEAQYVVSIVNPSDRYVLTLPGSSKYRLAAGDSGFANLYLAGDWIKSSMNIGAAEATVMSGMSCANAISGWPRLADIVGWGFGEPNFRKQ